MSASPRVDLDVYFDAINNLYDREKNPEGALPLNMAENKHSWSLLKKKIEQITCSEPIPEWVAGYTDPLGELSVRTAVANFLSDFLTHCEMSAAHLALSAGASSVIELTSHILGDAGDVAVIPAPAYPVYKQDLGAIAEIERFDLHTHHEIFELTKGSPLSIQHLDETFKLLSDRGKTFRFLILTNPDNPTGIIYSADQLNDFATWCMNHQVHLIVNEIYGLSLLDDEDPSMHNLCEGTSTFSSFAQMMATYQNPFLHLWYAFSKDFGISGFRVGLIHTHNESLLKAYANLNIGHMVSNHTQWLLGELLKDTDFIKEYIKFNQRAVTRSFAIVARKMKAMAIPYVPSGGSLFVWIDLSEFLVEETQDAENSLWMNLYESTGILLTPGAGFGHSKRGQFRIVHTFLPHPDLEVAMQKFEDYVTTLKK